MTYGLYLPNFYGLSLTEPSVKIINQDGFSLYFGSTGPNTSVITKSTKLTINFSTVGLSGEAGYPALFVTYTDMTGGGGSATPMWVLPGSCYVGPKPPPEIPPIDEVEPPAKRG